MLEPIITWYAKVGDKETYENTNDIYAGYYDGSKTLSVTMQLWNNRWGEENVADLKDFYLALSFDNIEDSSLFEYCKIILNKTEVITPAKADGSMAIVTFPDWVVLKGLRNDGTLAGGKDNYIQLEFRFNAQGAPLKEDDLKSLYFKIIKK